MKMLSKDEAVGMLERIISDREELPKDFNDQLTVLSVWTGWCRTTRVRIQRVFGTGSNQVAESNPNLIRFKSKAMRVTGIMHQIKLFNL